MLAMTPATLTKAALIAECRRLRVDEELTFREIGERLGVSETTAWKHAGDLAFVNRRCPCGAVFPVKRESGRVICDGCRDRETARLARKRNALICDRCKTTLLRPAKYCGFCAPDFDLEAALAALDNEERAADTARSTTHGGKP